jgi:non-ribosomal peptide synthase protein (TIGR01720 family)
MIAQARLGEESTGKLRRLQAGGVSLPDVLLFAFARALSREAETDTVQFWMVSHGRASVLPPVDLSRTVGFLVRGYPVRVQLPDVPGGLEAVRDVGSQVARIPHQGMGFEILENYFPDPAVRRHLARSANAIRLNYIGDLDRLDAGLTVLRRAAGWEAAVAEATQVIGRVPWSRQVSVAARIDHGDLVVAATYHSGAYLPSRVERLAAGMGAALQELADEGS